jgi:uncharacterized protein YndB with AHSA1/START domain
VKKGLLAFVIGLIALVGIAVGVGYVLPAGHVATHVVHYAVSPDSVWGIITDFQAQPRWFSGVRSSIRVADINGHPTYREDLDGFKAEMETAEWDPPRRLVRVVHSENAGFRGSWTWLLAPEGDGTRLTLIEQAEVDNPLFRVMIAMMDETATIRTYADALGARLKVEAVTAR